MSLFDDHLKNKFTDFESDISDDAIEQNWQKIKPFLPKEDKRKRGFFFFNRNFLIAFIGFFASAIFATIYIYQTRESSLLTNVLSKENKLKNSSSTHGLTVNGKKSSYEKTEVADHKTNTIDRSVNDSQNNQSNHKLEVVNYTNYSSQRTSNNTIHKNHVVPSNSQNINSPNLFNNTNTNITKNEKVSNNQISKNTKLDIENQLNEEAETSDLSKITSIETIAVLESAVNSDSLILRENNLQLNDSIVFNDNTAKKSCSIELNGGINVLINSSNDNIDKNSLGYLFGIKFNCPISKRFSISFLSFILHNRYIASDPYIMDFQGTIATTSPSLTTMFNYINTPRQTTYKISNYNIGIGINYLLLRKNRFSIASSLFINYSYEEIKSQLNKNNYPTVQTNSNSGTFNALNQNANQEWTDNINSITILPSISLQYKLAKKTSLILNVGYLTNFKKSDPSIGFYRHQRVMISLGILRNF